MTTQSNADPELEAAQKKLRNLERALKGALTSLAACPLGGVQKQSIQADLGEILFEVHHLTPYRRIKT